MKVVELREIARSQGLKGWYRLRKSDLISFIKNNENHSSDRATEVAIKVGKKTIKELKDIARIYGVKIRSGANKSEIIYLLGENYGERRRAAYEKKYGLWNSDIRADEEAERWSREIDEEERSRRPKLTRKAMNGNVHRWFVSGGGYTTRDVFLNSVRDGVRNVVDGVDRPIKTYAVLKCTLVKHNLKTKDRIFTEFNGRSNTHTITTELGDTYEEMKEKMLESLGKFQKEGSGWRLYSIIGLDISVAKFNPLRGSGYSKLPPFIAKKKAVINMKNDDDQCFKWAVTRALNPVKKDSDRITKELKNQAEEYDWSGITFPVKVKDIHIWEKNNNKFVNVFGYDEDTQKVYVIRMRDGCSSTVLEEEQNKFISLFLHDDNHYCVVKNLGRLVSSQISKKKNKKHFCLNCMNGFGTEKIPTTHQEVCLKRKPQNEVFPNPGEITKLKNYERLHDVPFAVYADFESFLKPLETEDKDPSESYTVRYQSHVPSGFCYSIKCVDETVYPTKTVLRTASYEGEDMGKLFVDTLTEDLRPIYEILKNPKPIVMTDSEKDQHKKTESCYACNIKFNTTRINEKTKKEEKVIKCADHCHITGKYRGAACGKCNLRMKVPTFVPVLFHNLEGYDAHLFVKSLGLEEGEVRCIPKTDEKYISFSKNIPMETVVSDDGKEKTICLEMRFLDSLKFTLKSLDSLTKTLGNKQFGTLTSQMFAESKSLDLLKRKGVFPYEYMTDFSKLSATSLPSKEAFYSQLTDSHISDEDYEHAQKVWKAFGCKTMRDYHDLYLKTDVLLLADVMTEFRKTCKKAYGLDALHYYTSPGLAWDAMLKFTGIELDLISDSDMYLMIEKGIRGGVSSIMKRYSKANHKYLDDYDPETKYDKTKYVLHHEDLKMYLEMGLKLTKIHRGITFEESCFMKSYIDLNTNMRTKGTTDFEKDFYKLMNNSVFGKTMENVRNRVNVKLVTNEKALNKLVKKPNYKRVSEFHENLVAVHMEKTTVKLDKPIYLGMSILDLSKTLMYKFHYEYVKPKWGDRANLLFTDTDSLCYEIETDDVYEDIKNDLDEWFDTSNYDEDHPNGLRSNKNKKVIGFYKDECGGKFIIEFVGLKAKSYSIEMADGKTEKKCKGVKKYVVRNHITHEDYKECLFSGEPQHRPMNTIRSRKHNVGSERINKTALSADDDKRIILEDGIHTLAIGHHKS